MPHVGSIAAEIPFDGQVSMRISGHSTTSMALLGTALITLFAIVMFPRLLGRGKHNLVSVLPEESLVGAPVRLVGAPVPEFSEEGPGCSVEDLVAIKAMVAEQSSGSSQMESAMEEADLAHPARIWSSRSAADVPQGSESEHIRRRLDFSRIVRGGQLTTDQRIELYFRSKLHGSQQ